MKNGSVRGPLPTVALVTVIGLLGLTALQLHNVEKRLVTQGEQLRALGETADRLLSQGVRANTAGGAQAAGPASTEPPPARMLHPDQPNFLKERDKHWPAPGAPLDGTLVRGWPTGDPKGFNSLIENAGELGELIENYAAMGVADRNWVNPEVWHGELATRIEITDDSKEFTIYLRPGVKWHSPPNLDLNGKYRWLAGEHPLTAKDFVFALDLTMNPQVENGSTKNYFADLESWKAVDDHTLVVRWKKKLYGNISTTLSISPVPEFLFGHDESGAPLPKETVGARFNRHFYNNKGFVGAGPYRMLSYEPGSRIRLGRNEDFYGDRPAIAEIDYPIYTDPNQTILKLKAHELSIGKLMPGQYRSEVLQYENDPNKPKGSPFLDGRIRCEKVNEPVFRYVGWNADRPLFSDKRVRRAMTMAFNRPQILESVFVGLGKLTTGINLQDSPYDDPAIQPLPFDLDGAKKLLAEAGWADTDGDGLVDKALAPGDAKRTPFEFTLLIYGSFKEYVSLANIFKEDLLKIGVKMNVDAAEWSLMQKRMDEKRFDAYTGAWGLGWDSDPYQIWHSSQADVPKGSNKVSFRNREADGIIEKLRETFDSDERIALFRHLHRILHEEQPYSFFFTQKSVYCFWNDLRNVEFAKVRPVVNTLPWAVARGPG